jgi:predicted O-linked N-acetylglucosamine transferase (SPINDLY family)
MDIALDPFPYNGTTTTCDAFWMGVPLVTLVGDRFISRVGTSLVRTVGLGDLAAETVEDYVAIARRLAEDIPRLTSIRARLRQDMMASPLGDAPRFVRDLETVFRTMWRRWCADRS